MDALAKLYAELEEVKSSPLEHLPSYGYSTKEEVISDIEDEIARMEDEREEYDYTDEELERERQSLCLSLGIPRYC